MPLSRNAQRPLRILVVDDEPTVRAAIENLLHFDRHAVTLAANVEEALEEFSRSNFDLVITDYEMQGLKGDELAKRLKTLRLEQRILMITAYAESLQASGNPLTGVDLVLQKPFSFAELRDALKQLSR